MVQFFLQLLDFDYRVVVTEGWIKLVPPQVFASLKPLMRRLWQRVGRIDPTNPKLGKQVKPALLFQSSADTTWIPF
jgi:hypothetical protein